MFTKSTKRKYLDDDAVEGNTAGLRVVPSYDLQRQSLLDMSLIKLQLCHMLVEPNLCRSVLIANTVRQIQEEMTQDGSWQMLNTQNSFQTSLDRLVATDILCRTSPNIQEEEKMTSTYVNVSKDIVNSQSQDIISVPAAISTLQTQENKQTIVCLWEKEDQQKCQAELFKSVDPILGTLEVKSPDSLDNPLEDLFSDVDTSHYDFDTMVTGMLGSPKMGHYDLLDNLSTSATSSSSRKVDLNELDHIMEILVGS